MKTIESLLYGYLNEVLIFTMNIREGLDEKWNMVSITKQKFQDLVKQNVVWSSCVYG